MELLSIIYTALIIVSVLITVTLIVSFISYKIKQKKEGNLKVYEKFPAEKRAKDKSSGSSSSSKQSRKPHRPDDRKEEKHSIKVDRERIKEEKYESRKKESEKRVKKEEPETARLKIPKKRIEVVEDLRPVKLKAEDLPSKPVKTSKPENEDPEDKTTKKKRKMHTLGDDILGNYADSDDEKFHTLKIKKK